MQTLTLTLVANPDVQPLDEASILNARDLLPGAAAHRWLSPGEACDISFVPDTAADVIQSSDAVRNALSEWPLDIFCQPDTNRRKRLLVADMDSTLIGQECIDELADFAGLKDKVAGITERAMRGEIEFEPALRERVGLLSGMEESVLEQVFEERITLTPGARALACTMRANGATTVIVSGGFTFFTERVAQAAGFDRNHANILEIEDGKLTGKVREPILGQQAKLETLRRYRRELKIGPDETMGVGDGANDLVMLQEAGLGVAFYAKPIVAEQAHARVEHGDLTALLFAQGYARDEFVE